MSERPKFILRPDCFPKDSYPEVVNRFEAFKRILLERTNGSGLDTRIEIQSKSGSKAFTTLGELTIDIFGSWDYTLQRGPIRGDQEVTYTIMLL